MAFSVRHLIPAFALVLAGLVMPAPGAHAQPAADGGNGARQFTVLAAGEADWKGIYYGAPSATTAPLAFSTQRRSAAHGVAAGALVFSREKKEPATGRVVRVPVARTQWPAGVRTALLVFVPCAAASGDGMEFDVTVLNDGEDAFPAGSLRVLNLTPVGLFGRAGRVDVAFAPGVSPALAYDAVKAPEASALSLALAVQTEAGIKPLYLGPVDASPSTRSLVLVHPPKIAGSWKVRVSVITQTMPVPTGL